MKHLTFLIIILTAINGYSQKKKHLYIADHLVDCEGVGKTKCMLIKEKIVDEWQTFYDQIEGFDYEEGYQYLIEVKIKKVKNPAADQSSERYILKKVFEKKKVEPAMADIHSTWKLVSMKGMTDFDVFPTFKIDTDGKRVSGNAGCNNYFGKYYPEKKELDFSRMGMTRKMCPEPVMKVENAYINNLRQVEKFELEGNNLFLYDKDHNLMITFEVAD